MLKPRKKMAEKKEIKQDFAVELYYKTINFFSKYTKELLIALGIIVIIVVAIIFYTMNKAKNNEKAGVELQNIMTVYNAGAYLDAINGNKTNKINGLKYIVEKYGNTENGNTAKIFLANAYFYLGKFNDALKYYDDYDGDNNILKASAYAGMASCYEGLNEFDKAAKYYQKAYKISEDNPQNGYYMLHAALNLIKLNQKEDAIQLIKSVRNDYKKDRYLIEEVDRYLSMYEN